MLESTIIGFGSIVQVKQGNKNETNPVLFMRFTKKRGEEVLLLKDTGGRHHHKLELIELYWVLLCAI